MEEDPHYNAGFAADELEEGTSSDARWDFVVVMVTILFTDLLYMFFDVMGFIIIIIIIIIIIEMMCIW